MRRSRQQVVALVNQYRASLGLAGLTNDATLSDSAAWKASHMATYGYFAHDDPAPPVARDPFTRMTDCGYAAGGAMGENIAFGQSSPSEVMTAWINSSGHRAEHRESLVPLDRRRRGRRRRRQDLLGAGFRQRRRSGCFAAVAAASPAGTARTAASPGPSGCLRPRRRRRLPRRPSRRAPARCTVVRVCGDPVRIGSGSG